MADDESRAGPGVSGRATEPAEAPERALPPSGEPFEVDARATLFGFDDQPTRARIIRRSRAWRVGGAARTFAVFVVLAPLVAVFPPHAVWFLGALAAGAFLARRRYIERFTLVDVEGECPRCSTPLVVKSGRLRRPHPLPCEGCNHEPSLRVPDEALEGVSARS